MRILLADDHRITLWGLQQLIESARPRMCVVGAVTTRDELLAHPALGQADVVLLDLDLAGSNAVDAMGELARRSTARVLVLTAEEDPAVLRNVVIKGARGVLHKSAPAETLLRAIEKVASGGFWLDATLLDELLGQLGGQGARAAAQGSGGRRHRQPDAARARDRAGHGAQAERKATRAGRRPGHERTHSCATI